MTSSTTTSSSSKPSGVPNRYPSMVVRGTHANIKQFPQQRNNGCQQQPHHHQQRQAPTIMTSAPKSYYNSMPASSVQMSAEGLVEFKQLQQRQQRTESLMRQSSNTSSNASGSITYHPSAGQQPVPAFETV